LELLLNSSDHAKAATVTFGLCCAVAFLDGADSQAMAIAAPAFARTIGIAPGALGILFSISLAGAALGAGGSPAAAMFLLALITLFAAAAAARLQIPRVQPNTLG
jgi:hypothetical protein